MKLENMFLNSLNPNICTTFQLQCDQIWPNFATWAKLESLLQNFEGLYWIWQIFKSTYFCNFYAIGRFCKWPNIYKTISPSGHTEAPSRLSSASALGSVTILCVVPTNMKEEVTPPFDTCIIVAIDKYGPRRYWAKIEMSNYWLKLKSLVLHRTCDAVTSRHTFHHQIFTL